MDDNLGHADWFWIRLGIKVRRTAGYVFSFFNIRPNKGVTASHIRALTAKCWGISPKFILLFF